jgi:hypothetical protein
VNAEIEAFSQNIVPDAPCSIDPVVKGDRMDAMIECLGTLSVKVV